VVAGGISVCRFVARPRRLSVEPSGSCRALIQDALLRFCSRPTYQPNRQRLRLYASAKILGSRF